MKVAASYLLYQVGCMLVLMTEGCTRDSKKIGVCLHTYLERDFPSLEMVVYPNKYRNPVNSPNGKKRTLLLEGPKLEDDCNHVKEVLDCFTAILKSCRFMEDFFSYRHLIDSLQKTHKWMCHTVQDLREKFQVVLLQLHCIEEVRKIDECRRPRVPENVWNRILRLEEDTGMCSDLKEQHLCLVNSRRIAVRCGEPAHQVYANMSDVFLSNWCSATTKTSSSPHLVLLLSLGLAAWGMTLKI